MAGPEDKSKALDTRRSTVGARRQCAVCVRRAKKHYGSKKNPNIILDNLNMTVPKGTIYGLLGSSGCGKTTLLSCIVGRRRLDSGEIWVLGGKPGSKGSGVPGPRVGYMPQEVALYGEFTIRETMKYFGWVAGMKMKKVDEKLDFLIDLLQLPPKTRFVKNLSGGQKRRTSLAVVLLYDPELMILDEPTSGVDPLLRQTIWDHLVDITKDGTRTVMITTHYIDETRQASLIGLMRGGHFLAEESPDDLLKKHECDSLENAFLKLALIQNKGKRKRSTILQEAEATAAVPNVKSGNAKETYDKKADISGEFGDNLSSSTPVETDPVDPMPPEKEVGWSMLDLLPVYKCNHMKALVWKNVLWMIRNPGYLLCIIGLPIMQIVLFCLTIGKDPKDLTFAVVDHELNKTSPKCSAKSSNDFVSCQYLKQLEKQTFKLKYYDKYKDAVKSVQDGKAWGVLEFPENYSTSLQSLIEQLAMPSLLSLGAPDRSEILKALQSRKVNNSLVDSSLIKVVLDMSNQQIALMVKKDLGTAYENMTKSYAAQMGLDPSLLGLPIKFFPPVYGPSNPNFTDFAAPGVMITIIFFLAVALTASTMIIERNEGILERGLVSGITGVEILTAHILTQFVVVLGQSVMVVVFALYVFDVTNDGDVILILIMIVLSGISGMTFGFVVSCVTDSERNATYLALGSFLPFIMLCGILWPVQGMNKILRTISYILPLTHSTESLRSIMARGWSISKSTVYVGYISMVLWIILFLMLSVLLIKFKKS